MPTDQTGENTGGVEAPPDSDVQNQAPSDLTREYAGRGITVRWYARRCVHVGACIKALPQVFNPRGRPWVDLSVAEAEADAVAEAVLRCPTGALHFERSDGGPQETTSSGVKATPVPNGPLLLRGHVEVFNEAGQFLRQDSRVAICRCRLSQNMPFCDNSHRAKTRLTDSAESVSSTAVPGDKAPARP